MTLQAFTGSTTSAQPSLRHKTDTDHEGIGPLSAELLIICLDPVEAIRTLVPFFEAQGITFASEGGNTLTITGRITGATASLPTDGIPQPEELESCSAALGRELQTMGQLRLVLVLGVSAHITALGACGIPLTRLDFRPGEITRLPDGLLLADACHLPADAASANLLPSRKQVLTTLISRIRAALRPSA